ncbi:MAG: phosphoglycerate dehydrogenase [Lachnospiraceae bacterium]|nr:phosphoglycerate dehydrogenase [Lachnospiraceae bacterium]
MPKVLVTSPSVTADSEAGHKLKKSGLEVQFLNTGQEVSEELLEEEIRGCLAMIAGAERISERVIKNGYPTLRVISRSGVGYDNIDLHAAENFGVAVTNTPGANTHSVAELVIGLMIALAREIPTASGKIRAGCWTRIVGTELYGKTLGILGTGAIGKEVAKRAAAFQMHIIACDLYPDERFAQDYGIEYRSMEEVLGEADFLTLHVPAQQGKPLIGEEELHHMKPTAYLINAARGQLVDEEALYEALRTGRLAGAGLDVCQKEPLWKSRLFSLEQVIFMPHVAGATRESTHRMGMMAAEEVLRAAQGMEPLHPVPMPK